MCAYSRYLKRNDIIIQDRAYLFLTVSNIFLLNCQPKDSAKLEKYSVTTESLSSQ